MTPINRLVKTGAEKRIPSNSARLSILRRLVISVVFALIVCSTVSTFAVPAFGDEHEEVKRQVQGNRISVSNNAITLVVVAGGKHPEFFWYANNDSKQVYKVQFKGIIEYLDFGQKIYQRRLNAELKDQIANRTVELRARNVSKAGNTVLVTGILREHRNQSMQKMYSYVLSQFGAEIGVNVTNSTMVKGMLKGDVVVRGTVMTSSNTTYLEAKNIVSVTALERELARVHPTFFEFNQARWNFSGFEPIKSGNITIGYQFSFVSQDIRNPKFSYLENQLEIRGRIYNTTVTEGNLTVTSASVKTDIIIKSWQWNLNSTAAEILNLNTTRDKLALWVDMTAFNANRAEDAISGKANVSSTEIKSDNQKIDIRPHGETAGQDEKELKVKGSETRLTFANESNTLEGFFNFTNYAYIYTNSSAPTEGEKVPVTAAYLPDGEHLRLFLLYPNFGAKSLEHDPTMGVDVTGIFTTPQYNVNIDSGAAQPISTTLTQTTTPTKTTSTTTTITTTTSTPSTTSTTLTSSISSTTTTTQHSSAAATTTQTTGGSENTGLPSEAMYEIAIVAGIVVITIVAIVMKRRA
jgi:hypothetical protein